MILLKKGDCFTVQNKSKEVVYLFLSFALPFICLSFTYYLLGMYPFGNNSLLTIDLNDQYLSFFSYFKDILHGEANMIYSFSKGMGGEMIGLSAYYLLSPFNLLFFFATLETLPIFVLLITLLKISAAGLSMYFLLKQKNHRVTALILSFCYSLTGYNIVYQQNIMWLDGVILLPLVIFGIEKIFYCETFMTYTLFLSIAIIVNYYVGFMLCLFSVIYFLIRSIELKNDEKNMVRIILSFFSGSLLAGGISALVTVPTLYSFRGGSAGFDFKELDFVFNLKLSDFFTKFYIGTHNFEQLKWGSPNIYTSLFVFVLVILFFLSKKILIRKKVVAAMTMFFLFLSFSISGINLFWHGLNVPNWYPYRYSFIFSFVLILIASNMLNSIVMGIKAIKYIESLISVTIFIIISIIIWNEDYSHLNNTMIFLSVAFVAIYCLIVTILTKHRKHLVFFFLFGLIFFEVSINNYLTLVEIDYDSYITYQDFIQQNKQIFTQLTNKNQFYRIEKTYHYSQNDPLLFNYNGLSHYSTTSKENEKTFLGKIGYDNQEIWAMYSEGSTIPADSLLGIKYILTDDRNLDYYKLKSIEQDISVYENPYAFSLGFAVSDSVYESIVYENPIDYQTKLFQQLSLGEPIFERIPEHDIRAELSNVDFQFVKNLYRFGKINTEEKGTINFYIKNIDNKLINFYFDIIHFDDANIYVDDQFIGKDFNKFSHTINVAKSNNDEVKITIELLTDQLRFLDAHFYFQNDEKFLESIQELNKDIFDIENMSDNFISGEVTGSEEKDVLLLTIPYDSSWKVKINGEETETQPAFDALLSTNIPTGKNEIELYYEPKGMKSGIFISVISLLVCGAVKYRKYLALR